MQRRMKRPTYEQKQVLIKYMELNRECSEENWDEITETLNKTPGPQKLGERWKQFWRDWRRNVRMKNDSIKKHELASCNRVSTNRNKKNFPLTDLEKRVMQFILNEYKLDKNTCDSNKDENTNSSGSCSNGAINNNSENQMKLDEIDIKAEILFDSDDDFSSVVSQSSTKHGKRKKSLSTEKTPSHKVKLNSDDRQEKSYQQVNSAYRLMKSVLVPASSSVATTTTDIIANDDDGDGVDESGDEDDIYNEIGNNVNENDVKSRREGKFTKDDADNRKSDDLLAAFIKIQKEKLILKQKMHKENLTVKKEIVKNLNRIVLLLLSK